MRDKVRLAGAYAFFALVATVVNLGGQWILITGGSRLGISRELLIVPALVTGTGLGLVVKYILDKVWIFGDVSTGVAAHARKFSLYTVMGLFTTAIFWGTELLFASLDPGGNLLYLGGAIGLAIGYVIKYQLDRRFVFDPAPERGGAA
jgi:putative flippase GtrA